MSRIDVAAWWLVILLTMGATIHWLLTGDEMALRAVSLGLLVSLVVRLGPAHRHPTEQERDDGS